LDKLRSDYLAHCLISPAMKQALLHISVGGATREAITKTGIQQFEIPLPPVDVQKRIARLLDQAEDLRRTRRRSLERLSILPQVIFAEMFGDPATNPKNIPTRALGELIKVRSGEPLIGANQNGGCYPVYGGNGINGWHDAFIVPAGTIVIGRVGVYCGVVHVTDRDAWVTDNALIADHLSGSLTTTYLAAALEYANLNQYAGKSAQPLVSGNRIYPVKIATPPVADQRVFDGRISEIERLKVPYRAHLTKLDALFASLQQRAFSGELKLDGAATELEMAG
jgi:type I restriction enzyme S subunit